MAGSTNTNEFNVAAIAQHLKKDSFAPIFNQSNEKNDHIALKLMCIVDYHAKKRHLYNRVRVTNSPKLLAQLMQFHSYGGTFKYYDYQAGKEIGKRVLQCTFCELIGPYALILTHMAINHNAHIGLKKCVYCNRTELKNHFDDDSLPQCYSKYIQNRQIDRNETICDIVTDFYKMLKVLAEKFKVITARHHGFIGRGFRSVDRFDHGYGDDIDENVTVFTNLTSKIKSKTICGHLGALEKEFKRVISHLYGGNNVSRLMQQSVNENSMGNANAIIINDSDDGNDQRDRTTSNANRSTDSVIVGTTSSAAADAAAASSTAATMADTQAQRPLFEPEKGKSDSAPFGQYIAQRLDRQPDATKRQKIEIALLMAMAQAEKEE